MSADDSFNFLQQADQSFHMLPITKGTSTKTNRHLFASQNPNYVPTINKCIKVLNSNKINDKWAVNEEFQNYLAEDDSNPDAVIVSFMGPQKNGKSFLVDSLVTTQTSKVCRLMSKNSSPLINCPAHNIKTRNNDRIIYLDNDSQTSSQIFLWNYFISSVIIYNMSPNDRNEQDNFFQHLYYVQSHLDSEFDELSQPQLIIVRRDIDQKTINDRDMIRKIQEYNLFQPDILSIHLPYPGNRGVRAKQILDVPLKQLQPDYLTEVQRLLQVLKTSKAKIIKGNYLSTKILSITLEPVTKHMNKQHRLSTNQIWNQVIESLSIGFYNYYLKAYSEQLEQQFVNQQPCDRYTIYKKLSKLKRKVNKKVQGFNNISDDPIFMRYKSKLEDTIKKKQDLVKEVNRVKSRNANQQYCSKVLSEINDQNYAQLIDEYCKSELDDQKTEVLLQNFDKILQARAQSAKAAKSGKMQAPALQLQKLEQELTQIDRQIANQMKPERAEVYNYDEVKNSIKFKQSKLEQLQAEYEDLRNASRLMSKSRGENQKLAELEAQCQKLNVQIGTCKRQIDNIRKDRQAKIKQSTVKLQNELKQQDEKLKKLEKMLRQAEQIGKPGKGEAQGGKKNSCCSIM